MIHSYKIFICISFITIVFLYCIMKYITYDNVPVSFFINLDEDKKEKNNMYANIKEYLPSINRISGVRHPIGKEGCRLAHIKANENGIKNTSPGEYYIILEDDAVPNVSPCAFRIAIKRCINNINSDLVLFNIQNYPKDIKMVKTHSPCLFRIYEGPGSGVAYMVKHEFGKKLVKHWKKHPKQHIDLTWQKLWMNNKVYIHKPLIFQHEPGKSKTGDVECRKRIDPECSDLRWDKIPALDRMREDAM